MTIWRRTKRAAPQHPTLPGLFTPQARIHRLATPHEQALEQARGRLCIAIAIFSLAFCVISARVSYLSLMNDAPEIASAAPPTHDGSGDSITARADITDRLGTVLATSLPTQSLCADGRKILNPDEAAKLLVGALPDLDTKRLNDDLRSSKHCVMIKRHLTPKQYYEVNKLGIAGLEFQPDERRVYPASEGTAHVVGYTDIDNTGIAGMERSINDRLEKAPEPVALSIDLRLQTVMRHELQAAMKEFHAIGAAGLVMDANTGEVLSLVSLPDFDPQHPGTASDDARFNRDTLGVYEMGSTFKIFNTAMALNSGLVRVSDQFDTTKPLEVGHHKIRDFEPAHRWMNVAEIFTHSSNIGSALMAERVGGTKQRAFLARLGLTTKVPFELPEVGAPIVQSPENWSEATTMTAAFGHGIAVNAVQLAGAFATIINNGLPVHPTLLKQPPQVQNVADADDRIITSRTSGIVRALLRLVVTRGTAKGAEVAGYMIGGKTGTADKNNGHGYDHHARMSSFLGAFPINAPKYVVFALLDDPKGNAKTSGFATGGMVAAPLVGRIVSQIGPRLGVQPLSPEMEATAERQLLKPVGSQIVDGMPVEEGSNYASVESDSVQ